MSLLYFYIHASSKERSWKHYNNNSRCSRPHPSLQVNLAQFQSSPHPPLFLLVEATRECWELHTKCRPFNLNCKCVIKSSKVFASKASLITVCKGVVTVSCWNLLAFQIRGLRVKQFCLGNKHYVMAFRNLKEQERNKETSRISHETVSVLSVTGIGSSSFCSCK